jgi:hypothetical protein
LTLEGGGGEVADDDGSSVPSPFLWQYSGSRRGPP